MGATTSSGSIVSSGSEPLLRHKTSECALVAETFDYKKYIRTLEIENKFYSLSDAYDDGWKILALHGCEEWRTAGYHFDQVARLNKIVSNMMAYVMESELNVLVSVAHEENPKIPIDVIAQIVETKSRVSLSPKIE